MRARGFFQLASSQAAILRRNTSFWLASIFTAVISMLVFGWLFNPSESNAFDLGIVDQDGTEASAALIEVFSGVENADLTTGSEEDEVAALKDGDRGAVVVIPQGFESAVQSDGATLAVYYDNSDLIRVGYVTATVQAAVDAFNENVSGRKDAVGIESSEVDTADVSYVDFLTPGMMGMTIMWVNLGVGFLMVTWRETGILRRLGVTPLRPGTLIASQAIPFAAISLVQVVIILVLGRFAFDVSVTGSYAWLAVTVLLGIASMLALGYILASVLRTATSVNAAVNLIALPMIFLGRSYFPLATPTVLAPLVNFIPLTHLNDALRQVMNRGGGPEELWADWAALVAWAIVGYAISIKSFRWQ